MKKLIIATICSVFVGMVVLAMPVQSKITAGDITGGKKAPHVNIAIFHKLHGHEAFNYPASIAGSDILNALKADTQYIAINHTAGLKDGDVIMISSDVLRSDAGKFEDFGVDCQMSIMIQQQITLAGICQILMMDQDGREIEHKGMVKPFVMKAGGGWQLIYSDTEDGIAIYASEEIGLE